MPNPIYRRRRIFAAAAPLSGLTNPAAINYYYNALVVANGGNDIDSQTIYNIPLLTFQTALNDAFEELIATGLSTKIKRWTPRIGNTAATQQINAINPGTYDGTFSGDVTYDATGVTFGGTNGKEATGFMVSDYSGINNIGVSFRFVSGSPDTYDQIIADSEGAMKFSVWKDGLNRFLGYINTVNYDAASVTVGSFYSFNRTTNNIAYKDGVIFGGGTVVTDSLSIDASELFIGGGNPNLYYLNGTLRHEIIHDALTTQESLTLFNIINTLDTALNR